MPVPLEVPASLRCRSPRLESWAAGGDASDLLDGGHGPMLEVFEDHCVLTFLHRAPSADAVYVQVNRITHTSDHASMERLGETGWWHASFRLPRQWRGSYSFTSLAPGDRALPSQGRPAMRVLRTEGTPDPLNDRREVTHTGGWMSWAQGDLAPAPPWLAETQESVQDFPPPAEHRTPSGRRVWVHLPPEGGGEPRQLVVVLDGPAWMESSLAQRQVRALAQAGVLREPVMVFVDPGDADQRWEEMGERGTASAMVAEDVVPWARSFAEAGLHPRDVVVTGESLGGLTAIRTVLDHPEVVGSALSQSASTWQDPLLDRAAQTSRGRFFITAGSYESALFPGHLALVDQFGRDGRLVGHREYVGGHDMAWWRGLWGEGLAALLSRCERRETDGWPVEWRTGFPEG